MKRRRKASGKSHAWIAFLLPSFSGVTVFVLLPFLDVIRRSFLTAVTGEWAGLRNYRNVFDNQAFRLAIHNTVRFTAVCLPLLIGLGLFMAVFLSRLKQIQLMKSLFLFPLAMPAATVVLIWKMVFSRQGFFNGILCMAGILPEGILPDHMGTGASFWVLVFSYVWKNLGYTMVLWLAGIFAVPYSMSEAARVDGAGEWQIFFTIGLPLGSPGILSALVLGFLEYWNLVEQPLAFLEDPSLWPLSLYLPEIHLAKAGMALAASVVTLLPAVFVFFMGQDYLEQGIVASGMKE